MASDIDISAGIDEAFSNIDSYGDVLDYHQNKDLANVAKCMAMVSHERWTEVINLAKSVGGPIMYVHMSDGWACNV